MVVTWVTVNTTESVVEYGPGALSLRTSGSVAAYRDGGSEHRVLFMHRVTLTQLKPQQRYGECRSGVGNPLSQRVSGSVAAYRDGGSEQRVIYMHRVTLTQLKPQQRYREYRSGAGSALSERQGACRERSLSEHQGV